MSWKDRLVLPLIGNSDIRLFSKFRVLPKDLYRLDDPWIFYIEWISKDNSNTKLYEQKKIVAYADYKIGMFYISPFDLYLIDGERVIN